mgnify:CR=1 FL=1
MRAVINDNGSQKEVQMINPRIRAEVHRIRLHPVLVKGDVTLWWHGQDLLEKVLTEGHLAFVTKREVSKAIRQGCLSKSAGAKLLSLLRQPETRLGMLPIFLYDPATDIVYQLFDQEIVNLSKWRPFGYFSESGGVSH